LSFEEVFSDICLLFKTRISFNQIYNEYLKTRAKNGLLGDNILKFTS